MLILKAYKFQLRPDGAQQRSMRQYAGSCRFVFNKALALQQSNHQAGGKFISYVAMAKLLTGWRHDLATEWLSISPNHPLQHALKDADKAYTNFFKGLTEFPNFKKKGVSRVSFRFPDAKQIKLEQHNNRIFLPKLGWLRYRNSRKVVGTVKNVTVSCSGGKWYASIQVEQEVRPPKHVLPESSAVGIDMGITRFATLSDGTVFEPRNSFKSHQQKLAKYQRAMSHKQKFSKNWLKAKAKVQKLHIRIGHVRQDYLHQASAFISKNHAIVCIEDLQVRNMSKSASGTVDKPGRKVRQKAGLNRAILDQGWARFREQLAYKQMWIGGTLIAVPPQYTSQECPSCTHTEADNRKTQAKFVCLDCGFTEHADLVGSINVKHKGLVIYYTRLSSGEGQDRVVASTRQIQSAAQLVCGDAVLLGRSVKQKPSEGIALVS